MKTQEEILIKHLSKAGCLDTEDIEERKDEPWFKATLTAMSEYARYYHSCRRDEDRSDGTTAQHGDRHSGWSV